MKKLMAVLTLAGTITCQAHAADLSQHIKNVNPSLDNRTVHAVARELAKYPKIMTYIVQRESTFNPKAHSQGNIGLAGINAKVWVKTLIEEKIIRHARDLWSIRHNLKAGFYILKHYNRSYTRYRRGH